MNFKDKFLLSLSLIAQLIFAVLVLIGAVVLIITSPIWFVPYLIYKRIKYGTIY